MTSIFEPLFDTYGDSVMREHGVFDETELMKALDGLSLEQPAKNEVCDLLVRLLFPLVHSRLCRGRPPGALPGRPGVRVSKHYRNCRRAIMPAVITAPRARAA